MSWIAVGIGAAVGATGGAIIGSKKGGDDVWKGALLGGALGAAGGGIGGAAFGGAGAAAEGGIGAGVGETALGAGTVEGGSGLALGGTGQMATIPGVTPAAGVFPSSVPATLQASVPGAVVGGPGMTSGASAGAGAGGSGGLSGWWSGLGNVPKAGIIGAGTMGLGALMNKNNGSVPEQETYTGPLSQFNYDPSSYTPTYAEPNVYKPRYAEGGITCLAGGGESNPMDPIQNPIYPQSQQDHTNFATSTQYPNSIKSAMGADYDARTNPMTGAELPMGMADGGIASLGGYSDGGQLLKGPGDGVSDSIPASIGRRQPARLADGEFVIPSRAVSELGNGSTDAGAKQLYAMLDRIDKKRKKGKGLAYQANPKKMLPA